MFQQTVSFCRRLMGSTALVSSYQAIEEDRRGSRRHQTDLHVKYRPANSADKTLAVAQVQDISAGGMNISTDREFRPSDLLTVELPGRAETTFLACVVHVHSDGGDRWNIGCTFPRELTWEDLQAFEAEDGDLELEQRSRPRYSCDLKASCQLASLPDAAEAPAEVLDVSTTGVRLQVQQALEPGMLLNVELQSREGSRSLSRLACIVHVNEQQRSRWAIGCNFISEIDEDDLRALL